MKKAHSSWMSFVLVLLVLLLLAGLPLAVWLDLSNLADANLRRQARDLNSVISSVRAYYGANVVGRVLASPGTTKVVHNYQDIPGAIPIPATLSLELGKVISEQQNNSTWSLNIVADTWASCWFESCRSAVSASVSNG